MNGSVKGTSKRTGIVLLSEVPVPVLKMRNLCRHFVFSKLGSVLSVKAKRSNDLAVLWTCLQDLENKEVR